VFGVMIKSIPVIACNGITFILSIYILWMILKYR
jgi:uncharacterized protein with PQ loop repeat